jgi:hypothetical protein
MYPVSCHVLSRRSQNNISGTAHYRKVYIPFTRCSEVKRSERASKAAGQLYTAVSFELYLPFTGSAHCAGTDPLAPISLRHHFNFWYRQH